MGIALLFILASCGTLLAGCSGKSTDDSAGDLIEAASDAISHADTIKAQGNLEARTIRSGDGGEVPCSLSTDYTTIAEAARKIVRIQSDIAAGYLDVAWNGTTDAYYLNGEDGDTVYLCQYVSGREKDAEWKKGRTSVKSSDLLEGLNPFKAMDSEQFRVRDNETDENADDYDVTAVGKVNGEAVKNLVLYSVSATDPLADYDFANLEFDATAVFHAEKSGRLGRTEYTPVSLELSLAQKEQNEEGSVLNTLTCKIKYTDLASKEEVKIPDAAKKGNASTELDNAGGSVYFEKLAETGESPDTQGQESAGTAEASSDGSSGRADSDDRGVSAESESGTNSSEDRDRKEQASSDQGTGSGRKNGENSPGIEGETANDYKLSTFMEFNLSGLDIKLGETKLTDLLDAGLSLDSDDASVRLDPGKLRRIYFEIGEDYLEVDLKNDTSAAQSLAECTTVGVKVHFYDYTAKVRFSNALTQGDYYGTYKLYLGVPTYELVEGKSDQCTWYDAAGLYHLEAHFSTENYLPEYLYMYLDSALDGTQDESGGGNG